jgi:hypothetical protein
VSEAYTVLTVSRSQLALSGDLRSHRPNVLLQACRIIRPKCLKFDVDWKW